MNLHSSQTASEPAKIASKLIRRVSSYRFLYLSLFSISVWARVPTIFPKSDRIHWTSCWNMTQLLCQNENAARYISVPYGIASARISTGASAITAYSPHTPTCYAYCTTIFWRVQPLLFLLTSTCASHALRVCIPHECVAIRLRLRPLWIYTALKHMLISCRPAPVWDPYEFTQLSNKLVAEQIKEIVWDPYEFTQLSNWRVHHQSF